MRVGMGEKGVFDMIKEAAWDERGGNVTGNMECGEEGSLGRGPSTPRVGNVPRPTQDANMKEK